MTSVERPLASLCRDRAWVSEPTVKKKRNGVVASQVEYLSSSHRFVPRVREVDPCIILVYFGNLFIKPWFIVLALFMLYLFEVTLSTLVFSNILEFAH